MARGIDPNVFFGESPCCTVRHDGKIRCDREKLVAPMLGIFVHYVQRRMSDQGANAEEATARVLSTALIEQAGSGCFSESSSFEFRELFGTLFKMVEQRIRASGVAHNEVMTRSTAGTAGAEGVHERHRTATRSSGVSQDLS